MQLDERMLRAVIEKTVTQTLEHIGFTVDKPNEIQADLIYIRKARQGAEEVQKWVRRTSISVALTGALYALWKGIKISL